MKDKPQGESGQQPHKWQPAEGASAACKICPQHRNHAIHIRGESDRVERHEFKPHIGCSGNGNHCVVVVDGLSCRQPRNADIHVPTEPPPLRGHDTDWDKVEADQIQRNLRSWSALPELDRLRIAAEECAHWNRMYREHSWEATREAMSSPAPQTDSQPTPGTRRMRERA